MPRADPGKGLSGPRFAAKPRDRAVGIGRSGAGWCVALVAIGLALATLRGEAPLLVWNASPSTPRGLYRVGALNAARVGDLVVAWAPDAARRLGAARGYVPFAVPLVKRVAARMGDRVCARGPRIAIGGRIAARRLRRDSSGRLLPWWSGCVRLRPGQLFLLSDDAHGFDGRYFGLTRRSQLVGSAWLIWASRPVAASHA